jgi:two-component system, NarL family, nitrate/nitrite response regulator NarL
MAVPILIVEGSAILRAGIAFLLEDTHYEVVAIAASVTEINPQHLDLVALAIVAVSSGADRANVAVRQLRDMLPRAKILAVADRPDACDPEMLLSYGADGCILDVSTADVLLKSLDLALLQHRLIVVGGSREQPQQPVCSDEKRGKKQWLDLSEPEREILKFLAQGAPNKAIASKCSIPEATVKASVRAILKKIGATNRTQAAIWAIENGVLDHRWGVSLLRKEER